MGTKINLLENQFSLPVTSGLIERYSLSERDACFVVQAFKDDAMLYNKAVIYFEDREVRMKVYDFEVLGLRFFVTHEVLERMYRVNGKGTFEPYYSLPIPVGEEGLSLRLDIDLAGERNRYQGSRQDASAPNELLSSRRLPPTKSGKSAEKLTTTPSHPAASRAKFLEFWDDATGGVEDSQATPLRFLAYVCRESLISEMSYVSYGVEYENALGRAKDILSLVLLLSDPFIRSSWNTLTSKWLEDIKEHVVINAKLLESWGVPSSIYFLVNLMPGDKQVEFFQVYCAVCQVLSEYRYRNFQSNHSMEYLYSVLYRGSRETALVAHRSLINNASAIVCKTFADFSQEARSTRWTKRA